MATANKKLIDGVVGNLPLFRQASRAHLAEIIRSATGEKIPRGRVVFRRGERLPGLYVLAYGLVKLSLHVPGADERVLRLAGSGETFGGAIAFAGRPSPIEATALADSMVVLVPIHALLALVEHDPRFARAMIADLSEHVHGLVADIESASLRTGMQRLVAYLESLAAPGDAQTCVHLPATKTVVAAHLGVTKETLSRLLRDLSQHGLVAVARRDVTLLDRQGLSQIIRGDPAAHDRNRLSAPRQARAKGGDSVDMRQREESAMS